MRIFDSQINKAIFSGREVAKLPADISSNSSLKLNFEIKKQKIIIELLSRKISGVGFLNILFYNKDNIENTESVNIEHNFYQNKRIEVDLQSNIDKIIFEKEKGFSGRINIGRITISNLDIQMDAVKTIKGLAVPMRSEKDQIIDGLLI